MSVRVKGTYASVNIEVLTFAEECYTAYLVSEIMILKCPFRAIRLSVESMENVKFNSDFTRKVLNQLCGRESILRS
jgi:hypothetical protein